MKFLSINVISLCHDVKLLHLYTVESSPAWKLNENVAQSFTLISFCHVQGLIFQFVMEALVVLIMVLVKSSSGSECSPGTLTVSGGGVVREGDNMKLSLCHMEPGHDCSR